MNTEPEFTKGPWHITTPNGPRMGWSVGPAWLGSNAGTPEGEANAHLIAAAPDMYAALRDAREYVAVLLAERSREYAGYEGITDVPDIEACLEKIDAAMTKAEGKA